MICTFAEYINKTFIKIRKKMRFIIKLLKKNGCKYVFQPILLFNFITVYSQKLRDQILFNIRKYPQIFANIVILC